MKTDGFGPLLVLLHGFPSSSFDFGPLLAALPDRDALTFDFLGFGLSEKPRDHIYSLLWQADLVEDLVAREGAHRDVMVAAHDMGTSVATELLARDLAGRLGFRLAATLLFNGSIVIERASLTWVQRLLRSPAGPVAARLSSERLFRWPGDLRLLWGMDDPVATARVFEAVRELRPAAPADELFGLGHYPQLEAPERVAAAVRAGLDPLL